MIYNFNVHDWDSYVVERFEKKLKEHIIQAKEIFKSVQSIQSNWASTKLEKYGPIRRRIWGKQRKKESEPEYWTQDLVSRYYWSLEDVLTKEARKHYKHYLNILDNVAVGQRIRNLLEDNNTKTVQLTENEYDIIKQYT